MPEEEEVLEEFKHYYNNKFIFNQKGGSLDINSSTGRESVELSHYSGSNIQMNNGVNSELATNNKQTKVVYDEFKTVGNTASETTGKDKITNVGGSTYRMIGWPRTNLFNTTTVPLSADKPDGFEEEDNPEIGTMKAFETWKKGYAGAAYWQTSFQKMRGGFVKPGMAKYGKDGYLQSMESVRLPFSVSDPSDFRAYNPAKVNVGQSVNEKYYRYWYIPAVFMSQKDKKPWLYDGVGFYHPIGAQKDKGLDIPQWMAYPWPASDNLLWWGHGKALGTDSPGLLKYGPAKSCSTEGGKFKTRVKVKDAGEISKDEAVDITLKKGSDFFNYWESKMGNGGDEIVSVKRHKIENIGAVNNDYPSLRYDPEGKSVMSDIGVAYETTTTHYDYQPMGEDVDNSSIFPCGNYTLNVGNRYNLNVGSGGQHTNTTGPLFFNGVNVRMTGDLTTVHGKGSLIMSSGNNVEITSPKIALRSPRQILLGSSVGIHGNAVVRGGMHVEGETYIHHITAPAEVQETIDTVLYGKFNTNEPRKLWIGEAMIPYPGGIYWAPVTAMPWNNLIKNYPHSHHFNNLPLTLMSENKSVRLQAMYNKINKSFDSETVDSETGESTPQKFPIMTENVAFAEARKHEQKWPLGAIKRDAMPRNPWNPAIFNQVT